MASWVIYAFVLYLWVVGSSLYKLFYPTRCPYGPSDARCVHPLLPSGTALDLFAFAAADGRAREPHALQREGGVAARLFAAQGLRRVACCAARCAAARSADVAPC